MKNFIFALLVVAAFSGCQKKEESKKYSLEQNGCPTGEHEFSSQDALCNGLKDDALNGNCALGLRYEMFQRDCGGQSWQ